LSKQFRPLILDPFETTNLLRAKYFNETILQIYDDLRSKIEDYAKNDVKEQIWSRDGNGSPICVPRDTNDPMNCFWTPGWCDRNGYL